MRNSILLAIMLTLFSFIGNMCAQSKLTIKVTNLDESQGRLMIALADSEKTFMTQQALGQMIAIENTKAEVVFNNLQDGHYAVLFYQDANENMNLDLGQMGIPCEKYGFSNNINPAELRRAPKFEDCVFEVKGDTIIEIKAVTALK